MTKITIEDLVPGKRLAVANQTTAMTPDWIVVVVLGVHGQDVRYRYERSDRPRTTPIERFLEIVNAPPRGPHHTGRPNV